MKTPTLTALLRLRRQELCSLIVETAAALQELPEGSPDRHNTEANLHKIRCALAREDFAP